MYITMVFKTLCVITLSTALGNILICVYIAYQKGTKYVPRL